AWRGGRRLEHPIMASQSATYYLKLRWFLIIAGIIQMAISGAMVALSLGLGDTRLRLITPLMLVLPLGGLVLLAQGLTYHVTASPAGIAVRYFHWRFAAAWDELERSEIAAHGMQWLVLRQPPAGLARVWLFATPEHLRGRAIPLLRRQAWRRFPELEAQLRDYAPQLFAAVGERAAYDPAAGLLVPVAPARQRMSRLVVLVVVGAALLNGLWLLVSLRGL
ncbi:MAG TPA: hypothetical protein VGE07_02730, partial [Herpetosiphonaceae bacterium]